LQRIPDSHLAVKQKLENRSDIKAEFRFSKISSLFEKIFLCNISILDDSDQQTMVYYMGSMADHKIIGLLEKVRNLIKTGNEKTFIGSDKAINQVSYYIKV